MLVLYLLILIVLNAKSESVGLLRNRDEYLNETLDYCPWNKIEYSNENRIFLSKYELENEVSIIDVDYWEDSKEIDKDKESKELIIKLTKHIKELELNSTKLIKLYENSRKLIEILKTKFKLIESNLTSCELKLNNLNYLNKQFNPNLINEIKYKIKINKYKLINLTSSASDVYSLPTNDNLLIIFNSLSLITIYNKQFKLIKYLNNSLYSPYKVTSNNKDKLFISDLLNDRILMFDFELNFIKQTNLVNSKLFTSPHGLAYFNDFIYVCDPFNKRIHRFNSNLEQHVSWILDDFTPYQIQITSNGYLAIEGHNPRSIRFYNLNLKLIQKYDYVFGDLVTIGTNVLVHSYLNRKFFIYEFNGLLVDELDTHGYDNLLNDDWLHGMTLWYDNQLVISTRPKNQLIII